MRIIHSEVQFTDFQVSAHFVMKYFKNHICLYPYSSHPIWWVKLFGSCQTHSGKYALAKTAVFTEKLQLDHGQQVSWAVFLRGQAPFTHFWENVCQTLEGLSVHLSLRHKWCPMKKGASSARSTVGEGSGKRQVLQAHSPLVTHTIKKIHPRVKTNTKCQLSWKNKMKNNNFSLAWKMED